MNQYWSDIVEKLTPYTPGEQPKVSNLIKLNTNENPYGPSPAVLAAISAEANDSLRLYPDPNSDRVKESVANFYSINAEQVFVGNGSDEILAHTFQALLKHERPVLFPDITYSFYPVYCGLYAIEYKTIPLNDAFQISIGDYTTPNGGIIFPNPNAPTGCLLSLTEIEQLLNSNPDSVVVIDEAYVDFGGDTAAPLIRNHPNLLVIQTLSKSRSLAGLRVGFAMGQSHLIEALERVKNSFNSYPLDRLAIAGAVAAFSDSDHFEQTRHTVIASREKLTRDLKALNFEVLPSSANFLLVRHGKHPADYLAQQLRDRNIIVRHFKLPRIENFLRITVGTDPQCQALTTALREILS
ncbi:MAG: histidinol-phosphate transaminase [Gammaproteobacteria bacterium]|jgi:histidinol-phosphate aminotransferase